MRRMNFSHFPLAVLLAICALGGGACNREEPVEPGATLGDGASPAARRPTIAFIMKTLNNPFFVDMEVGAREAADRLGVELIVQAPERELDIERQMQMVENMIQRKVDAIIITPNGSVEIIPAIIKANAAGIPVLIVDTRIDAEAASEAGAMTVTFIGSDNREGGRIAGEFLAQRLGDRGEVAVLEGIPGHETADARLGGFKEGIADAEAVRIVASQPANWERDQGFNVAQNMLQAHPNLNAIFAANDMMALGAIEAISAAGKSKQILVVGFDATDDAREAIGAGRMLGSVAQYPAAMGSVGVEKALEAVRGAAIDTEIGTKVEMIHAANLAD